ncbi:hypothetical protein KEM52_003596 [Ascosphaera acerosa]|nr:hypothetical protein KEM52_003596 [Ascosphaera acerosa]
MVAPSAAPSITLRAEVLPPPGSSIVRITPDNLQPPENPALFNDAIHIRKVVFIDEQHCPYHMEADDDDERSWHMVFYDTATGTAAGVLRLVPPPHQPHEHIKNQDNGTDVSDASAPRMIEPEEPYVKIGRVALLKEYRGKGLGRVLLDSACDWLAAHPKDITAMLNQALSDPQLSQTHTSGTGARTSAGADTNGSGRRPVAWTGSVLLHAQKRMEGMYAKCGFVTDPGLRTWLECDMVHVGMWKRLTVSS